MLLNRPGRETSGLLSVTICASGPLFQVGAAATRGRRLRAEEADRELGLDGAAVTVGFDQVAGAAGVVGDHLVQVVIDEVRGDAVVAGEAAWQRVLGNQPLVERPPLASDW